MVVVVDVTVLFFPAVSSSFPETVVVVVVVVTVGFESLSSLSVDDGADEGGDADAALLLSFSTVVAVGGLPDAEIIYIHEYIRRDK